MTRRQHLVAVGMALATGAAGSMATNLLTGRMASADAGPTTAPSAGRIVEAQQFRVVDANGKLRAVLGEHPSLGVGLFVFDEQGTPRAMIAQPPAGQGQPIVTLMDAKRRPRLAIGLQDDGAADVRFTNENGKTTSLWVGGNDSGFLGFYGANGKPRVMLGRMSSADFSPALKEASGEIRNAGLSLWDDRGPLPRVSLLCGEDGPNLSMCDRQGRPRFQLFLSALLHDDPTLSLDTADRKLVWGWSPLSGPLKGQ